MTPDSLILATDNFVNQLNIVGTSKSKFGLFLIL